jgi:hypothetical protein
LSSRRDLSACLDCQLACVFAASAQAKSRCGHSLRVALACIRRLVLHVISVLERRTSGYPRYPSSSASLPTWYASSLPALARPACSCFLLLPVPCPHSLLPAPHTQAPPHVRSGYLISTKLCVVCVCVLCATSSQQIHTRPSSPSRALSLLLLHSSTRHFSVCISG